MVHSDMMIAVLGDPKLGRSCSDTIQYKIIITIILVTWFCNMRYKKVVFDVGEKKEQLEGGVNLVNARKKTFLAWRGVL